MVEEATKMLLIFWGLDAPPPAVLAGLLLLNLDLCTEIVALLAELVVGVLGRPGAAALICIALTYAWSRRTALLEALRRYTGRQPQEEDTLPTQRDRAAVIEALRREPLVEPPPTTADEAASACSVCLEEFEAGGGVRRLRCGHHFHPQCIEQWVLSSARPQIACPLCNAPLT